MKIILFQFASFLPYSKMKIKTFISPDGPAGICKTLESEKLLNKRHQRKPNYFILLKDIRALLFTHWLIFMLDIFRS